MNMMLRAEDGGGSFLMGLLAAQCWRRSRVLFAPKRIRAAQSVGRASRRLRSQANDGYQQASEKVSQIAPRQEAYDRAKSRAVTGTIIFMPVSGSRPARCLPLAPAAIRANRA
jgi:hypothetical protein